MSAGFAPAPGSCIGCGSPVPTDVSACPSCRDAVASAPSPARAEPKGWTKRLGGLGAIGLLLWKLKGLLLLALSKLKFLALGLSKGGTLVSMLLSMGVYWAVWGWQFAAGLVLSIYVHEMGHVASLTRHGVKASPPMFVPGLGAYIRMRAGRLSPRVDARVGLAGPIWGLGAALVCYAVYVLADAPLFGALARLGGFINLFNLLPVWQLDGARAFHALTLGQRRLALAAIAGTWFVSGEGLLLIIGAAAAWKAWKARPEDPATPDWVVWAQYAALTAVLAWLSTLQIAIPGVATP